MVINSGGKKSYTELTMKTLQTKSSAMAHDQDIGEEVLLTIMY